MATFSQVLQGAHIAAQAAGSLRILVVGAGKMGEAIVAGWLSSSEGPAAHIAPASVSVANPGQERRTYMQQTYGVAAYESATAAADAACAQGECFDVVVLAVKPQVMMGAIADFASHPAFAAPASAQGARTSASQAVQGSTASAEEGPLFISIAAGISTAALEDALPAGARVVRVMPNTPLMVGAGASGVCGGANATLGDIETVRSLFGCLGQAAVVEEADMDAVCAVSGSGPAYVAAMIEAIRNAAAKLGLNPQLAETLATQTVYGTAKLMIERNQSAEDTRIAVCSPGGTTLAALDAMNAAGFNEVFDAGVSACAARSKELGSC